MDSSSARSTFEAANSFHTVSSVDEIFKYDRDAQSKILKEKPWSKELVNKIIPKRIPSSDDSVILNDGILSYDVKCGIK